MDSFYRAFEDKHRGSRSLIKSRLEFYIPFIAPLKKIHDDCLALDLGCGRGEWLELLKAQKFGTKGVDLDEGMLAACRELRLDVTCADILEYLKKQPDESVSVVSAFHVVEHLPFEILRCVVSEAHRVLKPGGLIILETPNSENIVVGTSSFYLDPTHERPIPASLLTFLTEFAGFARTKVVYLNESTPHSVASLWQVFEGVSPDYAVIAQKKTKSSAASLFDVAFNRSYGTTLKQLVQSYEQQIEATMAHSVQQNKVLGQVLKDTQKQIDSLTKKIAHLEQSRSRKGNGGSGQSESYAFGKESKKDFLFRCVRELKKRVVSGLKYAIKKAISLAKRLLKVSIKKILFPLIRKPYIKKILLTILNRMPRLKQKLKGVAMRFGNGKPHVLPHADLFKAGHFDYLSFHKGQFTEDLSPLAAKLYAELKSATEERKKHAYSD